jgi:hypothetical protein
VRQGREGGGGFVRPQRVGAKTSRFGGGFIDTYEGAGKK